MTSALLVIGDRDALAWILTTGRMAFASHRAGDARALQPGARLFVYTPRGCFHNPTRDRGRVIGTATVATPAEDLDEPVRFGQRSFTVGLTLDIEALVPFGGGVVLADHVHELEAFPDAATWSARMRRTLVPLSVSDAALLERLLSPGLVEPSDAIGSYLDRIPDHDRSCRA